MKSMQQIAIHEFGAPEVLTLEEAAPPVPGPHGLLIRVHYAGLNPLDYKMRDGSSGLAKSMSLPAVLGREFVGEILDIGADVDLEALGLAVGQTVFGVRPNQDLRGCYAEKIAVCADHVAPIPTAADEQPFGGLALAGLTAISAVEECARVQAGDRVLVHGGSGGVGQLIVAMARETGANVWATGRAANASRFEELGATPIPYDEVDWIDAASQAASGGFNAIIDTHYFTTFLPSLDLLRDGGRICVLPTLADITPAQERGIDVTIPAIDVTRNRLDRLASGLADGRLSVEISEVITPEQIADAHRTLEDGHSRGKLLLDLS